MINKYIPSNTLRKRRTIVSLLVLVLIIVSQVLISNSQNSIPIDQPDVLSDKQLSTELAIDALNSLEVKGRAPKTNYSRSQFGSGWAKINNCDVRNLILQRDLVDISISNDGCVAVQGVLKDPYTGREVEFTRGKSTSDKVQIDHVVALSDAWQKGAQTLDEDARLLFANDSLNLLAVYGQANQQKGDGDAATWLPSNKNYRCRYVARQIAVKKKYGLWVTEAEKATMQRILNGCSKQRLPIEEVDEG